MTMLTASHVVSHVTVYEDRADVVRRCIVDVPAGASAVVLRDLSPLIEEGRVLARIEGDGHVDDIRIDRRFSAVPDAIGRRRAQREAWRVERLDERAGLVVAVTLAEQQRRLAESVLRSWASSSSRRTGRGAVDIAHIEGERQRLQQAVLDADTALVSARANVARLDAALAQQQLDEPTDPAPRRVCDVVVRLSAPAAGTITIVVSTVVPCAAWRPEHDASLSRDNDDATAGTVHVAGHGSVWNRTGEDWRACSLTLSTARPSLGAQVPSLSVDRLRLRAKTAEERRTIVVQHRTEAVPKDASRGGAPGVDDGGEVRAFSVENATILDDGRPHRLALFAFSSPAKIARVAVPEKSRHVFLRASFRNAGSAPLLAGPVQLRDNGAFVGVGDVNFVGVGDDVDLAFGSDDAFTVDFDRRRIDEKRIVGKDLEHWVQEARLTSTRPLPTSVSVVFRLPVSELAQLKVLPSSQHTTIGEVRADDHGLVHASTVIDAGGERKLALAFSFDTSGDVVVPAPW
jgi:uncharacterized protein (TIGR02231 family)